MMKLNKKYSIVAVALIALMCAGTAYALITIWSDPVGVNLTYTVTITDAHYIVGSGMYLQAQVLTHSGGSGVSGVTVSFYESADNVYYYWIGNGTATTNGDGNAWFTWTGAGANYYYFKAYCEI